MNRMRRIALALSFVGLLILAAFIAAAIYCPVIAAVALLVACVIGAGGLLGVNP